MSSPLLNSSCRRLLHDLKELHDQPLRDASAAPLDNDLYEWHANLTLEPGVQLHLLLQFPTSYPSRPPTLTLCTPLPHANVFDKPLGYSLCLDMLEHGDFAADGQKTRPWSGWSSSYTVRGILMQLQAHLLNDQLLYAEEAHGTMERAVGKAKRYFCDRCNHSQRAPFPPMPTDEDINKVVPVLVKKPVLLPVIEPPPRPSAREARKLAMDENDGWITVPVRHQHSSAKKTPQGKHFKQTNGFASKLTVPSKQFGGYVQAVKPLKPTPVTVAKPTPAIAAKPVASVVSSTILDNLDPEVNELEKPKPKKAVVISLSEVGHVMLEYKLPEKKDKNGKVIKPKYVKKHAPEYVPEPVPEPVYQALPEDFDWKAAAPLAGAAVSGSASTAIVQYQQQSQSSAPSYDSLGSLRVFPYELLIQIFSSNLSDADILRVSQTCRMLRAVCEDGHLWRKVFQRLYPRSRLTAARFTDWKHVYQLEVNQVGSDLVCFHTKTSFDVEVLGIPVEFTVNPRTRRTDYIASTWDLVSRSAFHEDKVRVTVFKQKFTDWLPLYLTRDHFERALPEIKHFMVRMSPHLQTNVFECEMVLEVIPKMMNTLVVLICDKGEHASEKAIAGYFQLHRLLVALVREFPQLQTITDQRIARFLNDEASRQKDQCSSLGDFLPLLSVSRYTWTSPGLARAVMGELFDRNVLWICKAHPDLAKVGNDRRDVPADHDRLTKSFEAGRVSKRLIMYHVYFLWLLRREPGQTTEDVAASNDCFYGMPPRRTVTAFQERVRQILEVKQWDEVFQALFMPVPTPEYLTNWLVRSVRNSLRKRYHTRQTDFSAIHRSGVSKILLKGESYSAPPNLRKVVLEEVWRWPGRTIFLDASCSFFDVNDKHLGNVDFNSRQNMNRSIVHSGDVVDDAKKEGRHTISVDLVNLPANVKTLVFCMSAWTTTLTDIKQPYVRFTDPETDMELCQYNFESKADTGSKTAIIMCTLWRDGKGKWNVTAIGNVGFGRVSAYEVMLDNIGKILEREYGKTRPKVVKAVRDKFLSDDAGDNYEQYDE